MVQVNTILISLLSSFDEKKNDIQKSEKSKVSSGEGGAFWSFPPGGWGTPCSGFKQRLRPLRPRVTPFYPSLTL